MKLLHIYLLILCFIMSVTSVSAQSVAYSKPAGFVTHILKPQQLNLIGLTLHEAVMYSGSFDTVEGTTLVDANAEFDDILKSGRSYILEIVDNPDDPSLNGVIQIITDWTASEITTPDNLTADGLVAGADYKLRAPKTISDVFGVNNSAGLTAGANMASADVIWLHNGVGFDKFYYSEGRGFGGGEAGWKASNGADAGSYSIIYTDAIIIQSRSTENKKLVMSGVVKTDAVTLALLGGAFNFISSTYPVGSTLANSGLEVHLSTGELDAGQADVVWMPNGQGDYQKYTYSSGAWKNEAGEDASATPLTSGIIIERVGEDANAKLTPPENYDNL